MTASAAPGALGSWTLDDTIALLGEGRPDWSLTSQQRAAVGAPLEPGLIVAGAGSGKTEVMAARVVHLVATGQVRPDEVLGLTFTTKATASLAARVRSGLDRLRERVGGPPSTALAPRWDGEPVVLTYNGYGARLVADHGLRIGIEPAARLAPEGLRWQLALAVVRRWAEPLDVDWTPATVAERVRQLADEMSSHLAEPGDVIAAVAATEAMLDAAEKVGREGEKAREVGRTRLALLRLVEAFVRAKRDGLLLDYGDQVALAAKLACQPVVVAAERTAHRVVLLDEYQDTGVAQRMLLQRLFGHGHPVTAVGDPAQSIYGFRGASVGNILNFPRHFPRSAGATEEPARQYPLTVNFRSGGAILEVANVIVAGLSTAFGAGRVAPTVLEPRAGRETHGGEGGDVSAALLSDALSEADWVAERLEKACAQRRGRHSERCRDDACQGWHEVAVLCRRRSQFGLLRQALERRGIPVEVIGLGGLLDAPEVADVVAVLRVLHDATANAALIRLLTGPRWRIGLRDLDALGRRAAVLVRDPHPAPDTSDALPLQLGGDEAEVGSLSDALEQLDDPVLGRIGPLSSEALSRLRRLRGELASLRRRLDQPLPDLIADIERTIGLDVELEATPDRLRQGRRANVLAFLDVAADFVGLDGQTDLGAFLASLEAAERAEDGYDLGVPSAADTVKLMTVHAAKGLEWDVVAVPGLSKGIFPSNRGTAPWPWRPEALPGKLRGDRDDLPVWTDPSPGGCTSYREATKEVLAAEDRRLAYVAVTRAREVLLCSGFWWSATATKPLIPRSEFFAEVERACSGGAGVVEPQAPEPDREDENPLLAADRVVDVQWPPAPVVMPGTHWAAAAVRRRVAMADPDQQGMTGTLTAEELERIAGWQKDAQLLLAERRAGKGRREISLPATLAVSDLVELAADPDQFAARVARPLPAPPAPAARRGSSFHGWLEQRSAARALIGPDELPGSSDPEPVATDADLEALKSGFLATSWAAREPAAVEVAFELVLDGVLVRGRIDAVYRRDDGDDLRYDVIDYKTGARPSGAAAQAAAVQLACYRLAWADIAQVDPGQVGAAFLYVREGEDGLVRPPLPSRDELAQLLTEPGGGAPG